MQRETQLDQESEIDKPTEKQSDVWKKRAAHRNRDGETDVNGTGDREMETEEDTL